jgi:hypothetical protein
LVSSGTPALTTWSLYNFDVGGDALKPEHRTWLDVNVLPHIGSRWETAIWLHGRASRAYDGPRREGDEYNLGLSGRRAASVQQYLTGRGLFNVHQKLSGTRATGRQITVGAQTEDELDRAVDVTMAHAVYPSIPPPPPPPPQQHRRPPIPKPPDYRKNPHAASDPPLSTHFKLRFDMAAGISGSEGLGLEFASVVIVDTEHDLACVYDLIGVSFTMSLIPGGPPISASGRGAWNHFITSAPMLVQQFGGSVHWISGSAITGSRTGLILSGVPWGVAPVIIRNLQTGTSLIPSISGSVARTWLELRFPPAPAASVGVQ